MFFYNLLNRLHPISKIISTGSERTVKTKKNIFWSFIYKGLSLSTNLMIVPLSLSYLSPVKYGIWLTLSSIFMWFGFLDVGLGNGLRNKFAEAIATNQYSLARKYVSTTYAIVYSTIFLIYILFLISNSYIDWLSFYNVTSENSENIKIVMLIAFTGFCLRFALSLLNSLLSAVQKSSVTWMLDASISLLSLLAIIILKYTTNDSLLVLTMVTSSIHTIVLAVANVWFFRNDFKRFIPAFEEIEWKYSKDLGSVGIQFFLLQIVIILIFFSNNIIITQLFGPEKVAEFNIPHRLFNIITLTSVIILNPFWSAATEAYYKNDKAWLKKSINTLIKCWLVLSLFTILLIICSPYIYKYWIGNTVTISFQVTLLMGVFVILLSWQNIFIYIINGIGKIRLQLYVFLLMAILLIPLCILFTKNYNFGVEGIVLASIISLIPTSILIPYQLHLILSGKAKGIFNK